MLWHLRAICPVLLAFAASDGVFAQLPVGGGGAGGSARPIALPQSGRMSPAGSASMQQSTSGAGVDTVNTSIQVGGDLQGSVPGAAPAGAVTLTLADAVRRGLETNLGLIAAGNSSGAAAAQRIQALSALLPNISANASETVTQVNLAAYGFQFKLPPGVNFSIPSVVGPFSYSQLGATLSESVYDPVARRNWKATKELESAAQLSAKDARELVVLAVAGAYMQTVATGARIDSQRAQVTNAQAVYDQAQIRKTAGTNARIDVMRTLVELQTQKQRLNSLESDFRKQKLALARMIGLPLDRDLSLSEPLTSGTVAVPDPGQAVKDAFEHRSDLKAAEAQLRAAERALDAAHAERLPTVSLNGNYGVLGPNPTQTHGVFTVTGGVSVPIWQGGRIKGDVQQADATVRQRQAEFADQRGRVEQEVRTAVIELETAAGQVQLAESNRGYAAETLREAQDRFHLGVATTVEVVQAQEQVAAAESDFVSGLLSFDLARLNLSRATGKAESTLPDLLKGTRP
ncbi:MAG TPA: TolC family protein [Bryobacteraceae bacterium]|nr:TolC family protein [Bryobacteraceae bacterium]